MRIHEAAARNALQLLPIEDLPNVATQALGEGLDSRALRMLAASGPEDCDEELQRLFTKAAQELGIDIPDKITARILLPLYLRDIAEARVSPASGVRQILYDLQFAVGYDLDKTHVGEGLGIERLLSDYYSYEDAPCGGLREEAFTMDKRIVEEAKKLLAALDRSATG